MARLISVRAVAATIGGTRDYHGDLFDTSVSQHCINRGFATCIQQHVAYCGAVGTLYGANVGTYVTIGPDILLYYYCEPA